MNRCGSLSFPGEAELSPSGAPQSSPGGSSSTRSSQFSDNLTGLGFPHHAGWCQPGRTHFSSPGCRSYSDMEVILSRGWGVILRCWR